MRRFLSKSSKEEGDGLHFLMHTWLETQNVNAIETKKNKNKMEEKIVKAMEMEHATLRGGKAKPSSKDE